jgi:hypothetical protein
LGEDVRAIKKTGEDQKATRTYIQRREEGKGGGARAFSLRRKKCQTFERERVVGGLLASVFLLWDFFKRYGQET